MEKFNQAMSLISEFLAFARSEKTAMAFKDKFDEIYFFKFEKPEYYAQKIFLACWFGLMNGKPSGTEQMLRDYWLEELKFISRFFKQHAFHYGYYRSGFTEMDEILFLRGAEVQPVFIPEVPELDPGFSTAGDYLFAKFIAYELLQEFILEQLKELDRPAPVLAVSAGASLKTFRWTGDSINLVELGYALYLTKQLNDGKAGLTEIFRWLEEAFGLEIGIPANRLREIKNRKRLSKLKYLDSMQEMLMEYIDKSVSMPE
ncbi:RteC domain-containing protein [Pararcticibacter amylolyticus]|uniref:RteC domain-containing protein n=1 Tax=Pararcticibacter amylolyticus TaxID=2173175 RepID=UPI00130503BE|nr:RteC domain-containing protein [Pararcticibacter amylolyticus]